MSMLYRIINPIVKTLLRSPLHSVLSNNTMILSYRGQRTGKRYELPISYARIDEDLYGFTAKSGLWWRNFTSQNAVKILVAGQAFDADVSLLSDTSEDLAPQLASFLRLVPRDAKPAGVRIREGQPVQEDVSAAVQRLVGLRFRIKHN